MQSRSSVAVGIMCKTPQPGFSKTRLSPPLTPSECAELSACFIRDLGATIGSLSDGADVVPYAVYTPIGSEDVLRALLPPDFRVLAQVEGDLGQRLRQAIRHLLDLGHAGAILVNSDSPTLPAAILHDAICAVRSGDAIVLSPAQDGGYTLVGMSRTHSRIFEDIPWSTAAVYRVTLERAAEIGIPVANVAAWYDVDDLEMFELLERELAGERLNFAALGMTGADAAATRRFLARRALARSKKFA
jgi:uncharacterized protein